MSSLHPSRSKHADIHIRGGSLALNVVIKILELRHLATSSHQPINLPLPTAVVLNYAALDFNFTSWMSADSLRVLRSEQSSGNLPGLREVAELKDHLKHVVSHAHFCAFHVAHLLTILYLCLVFIESP